MHAIENNPLILTGTYIVLCQTTGCTVPVIWVPFYTLKVNELERGFTTHHLRHLMWLSTESSKWKSCKVKVFAFLDLSSA